MNQPTKPNPKPNPKQIAGKITPAGNILSYVCPSCGDVVKIVSKPGNRVDPEFFVRGDYCKKCKAE